MFLKNCTVGTIVALSPPGNSLINAINSTLSTNGQTIQFFNSDADIDAYVRNLQYGASLPKFCYAISVVQNTLGGSYKYKVRFNETSGTSNNTEGPASILPLILDSDVDLMTYYKTGSSGYLGTITFVNNLIFQAETGSSSNAFLNVESPIYQ